MALLRGAPAQNFLIWHLDFLCRSFRWVLISRRAQDRADCAQKADLTSLCRHLLVFVGKFTD